MISLKGKRILVTGGASGIGARVVKAIFEDGGTPECIDLVPFAGSKLQSLFPYYIGYHQGDITDQIFVDGVIGGLRNLDGLDGLVNNAAFYGLDSSFPDFDAAQRRMMEVNVFAARYLIDACTPLLRQSGGSIVQLGSIITTMCGTSNVAYASSKAACETQALAYANKLAPDIRVNVVAPGNVNTDGNIAQFTFDTTISGYEGRALTRKSVTPEQVAQSICFLLSDGASGINRQRILVTEGYEGNLHDPAWDVTYFGPESQTADLGPPYLG